VPIDVDLQVPNLVGRTVPRPSGTLSGHAAGLPFEHLVHGNLLAAYPNQCRRHYEMVNEILLAHPKATTYEERAALFGPEALQQLVMRGKQPTIGWSPENLFEEKQNDTAESIVLEKPQFDLRGNHVTLVDVKTRNNSISGQPPNIMSAGKLAEAMRASLQAGKVAFDIVYVGITFEPTDTTLVCREIRTVSLFKIEHALYINWAAAEQIQFHVSDADQDFDGTREQWAHKFLSTFCQSLDERIQKQNKRLQKYQAVLSQQPPTAPSTPPSP